MEKNKDYHYEIVKSFTKKVKVFDEESGTYIEKEVETGGIVKKVYDNPILIKQERIKKLKKLLSQTDYQAIKYAEGQISSDDYAETKALRQTYRDEINQLEEEIIRLENM